MPELGEADAWDSAHHLSYAVVPLMQKTKALLSAAPVLPLLLVREGSLFRMCLFLIFYLSLIAL